MATDDEAGRAGSHDNEGRTTVYGSRVHLLRELDRSGRWVAAIVAVLLVLVPMGAAFANRDRWEPQGDDALIVLRALDVGTARTPLVGQPSTSGAYGERAENVAHPGPLGFVVLTPAVRVLGLVRGALVAAALVAAISMVAAAWLLFRHLGRAGGLAGAVLVSLAALTAGGANLVDPLSSNFGRMPLLAAAVAVWALLLGDVRIAPLAVGFCTFAGQQHLSTLPASAVLGATGVAALLIALWRAPSEQRGPVLLWSAAAVGTAVVLWAPVLWQELTVDPGNLTALSRYSGDDLRVDLGLRSAVSQVANALGPRPFLGRSNLEGWDLVAQRSGLGTVSTFVVLVAIVAAGMIVLRRDRRYVAAVVMLGVLMVAGIATGMNIPSSFEQGRLNFYHWAFALSFFELLIVGWLLAVGASAAVGRIPQRTAAVALTVVSLVVIAAVAAAPVVVDRTSDRLIQPLPAPVVRSLIEGIEDSGALAGLDGPVLVIVNGNDGFIHLGDTVGSQLAADGQRVVFPQYSTGFVHPDRLADPCTLEHALVVSILGDDTIEPPGVELIRVDTAPGLDREALERLVRQAAGEVVDLGDDAAAALAELPGGQGDFVGAAIKFRLASNPEAALLTRANLDLLIEHPIDAPALDRDDLVALRDSMDGQEHLLATEATAHLLDREELDAFRPGLTAGC